MNFRMLELEQTTLYGVSKPFDGQGYKTREELRHIMWADDCDDVPGRICEGHWNQPSNHAYDGIWYGIWKNGNYMIARPETSVQKNTLEKANYSGWGLCSLSNRTRRACLGEFQSLRN